MPVNVVEDTNMDMESMLQTIVEGTCSKVGDNFFRSLVRHLALATHVRYALITKCSDSTKKKVKTLAFWAGEDFGEDFEYELAGTPCENVIKGEIQFYPQKIQMLFPKDKDLIDLGAESYLGVPFFDSSNNLMGHLAIIDTKPMQKDSKVISVFKIFAARAGAELERKQAEQALLESKERLHILSEVSFEGNMIHDQGKLIDVNKTFAEMFGYKISELVGQFYFNLVACEYHDLIKEKIRFGFEKAYEVECIRKDGSRFPAEIRGKTFYYNGDPLRGVAIRDITERKRAEEILKDINEKLERGVEERTKELLKENRERKRVEEALKKSESKYRRIIEGFKGEYFFYSHDPQGVFTYLSPSIKNVTGYSAEEMFDHYTKVLTNNPINEKVIEFTNKSIQGLRVPPYEVEICRKDGDVRQLEVMETPVFDDQKNVIAVEGIAKDITERKKAEEALKLSEKELREQKIALEQKNLALQEILGQIEIEKRQIEDNVMANVDKLLLPILKKLKRKGSKFDQENIDLLQHTLENLTATFGKKVSNEKFKLTPREIEICNMIVNGLTSKEISQLLTVAPRTIEIHRNNIRKKLGISKEKINLTSYLQMW